MQLKVSSILFSTILMTNFSAIAQSLDKRPVTLKPFISGKMNNAVPSKLLKVTPKFLESKTPPVEPNEDREALKSEGGVATGGGNRLKNYEVGSERVARMIENAKLPTSYALRSVEFTLYAFNIPTIGQDSNSDPDTIARFQSLYAKLFGGKATIYEALQHAVLQPQLAGPCLDTEGKAVDGSAKDAPNICFSVERLASLDDDSAQREIIALVAHEVSHMLGTDEAEATMLQYMVRSNLSSAAIDKIPDLVKNYTRDFGYAVSNAQVLLKLANEGKNNFVCKVTANFQAELNTLLQTHMNSASANGVMFLRPEETKVFLGAMLKTMNIMAYCMSPDEDYMDMLKAFKGRNEISLQEMNREMALGHTHTMPVPNWKIRNIKKVKGALPAELGDVLHALTTIREKM